MFSNFFRRKDITTAEIVNDLQSNRVEIQTNAAIEVWALLERENPPIIDIIDSGIILQLIPLLMRHDCPKLQLEALWALIPSDEPHLSVYIQAVTNAGIVPVLNQLLTSVDRSLLCKIIRSLVVITDSVAETRNSVFNEQFFKAVEDVLFPSRKEKNYFPVIREMVTTLVGVMRQSPTSQVISKCMAIFFKLMNSTQNGVEVLSYVCEEIGMIIKDLDTRISIDAIVKCGMVPRLVELLEDTDIDVLRFGLDALGIVLSGEPEQIQTVIDAGALPKLCKVLFNHSLFIREWVVDILSHINIHTPLHIQPFIDADFLSILIETASQLKYSSSSHYGFDIIGVVQKEVVAIINRFILKATPAQVLAITTQQVITNYSTMLTSANRGTVIMILEGLTTIMEVMSECDKMADFSRLLENSDAIACLAKLQENSNADIARLARRIFMRCLGPCTTMWRVVEESCGAFTN